MLRNVANFQALFKKRSSANSTAVKQSIVSINAEKIIYVAEWPAIMLIFLVNSKINNRKVIDEIPSEMTVVEKIVAA